MAGVYLAQYTVRENVPLETSLSRSPNRLLRGYRRFA
jgi:hypothetical protein